jgi:PiT family inorganic phosphate transporter
VGKRLASVHWGVAGQMAMAWLLTIPAAGLMGAAAWEGSRAFGSGSGFGSLVTGVVAAAVAGLLFRQARRTNVSAHDLDRSHVRPEDEARAAAGAPIAAAA